MRAVCTSPAREDDLRPHDFENGEVWVEYEDAGELLPGFRPDPQFLSEEGWAVRIDGEGGPLDEHRVRDLNRLMVGCSVLLGSGRRLSGIAQIRGSDLEPYAVAVFTTAGSAMLMLTASDPVAVLGDLDGPVFPVSITYEVGSVRQETTKTFG